MKQYCQRLHYNPLLIKWFVQAVGKGTRPEDVLSHEDLGQALRFCLGNVYARLSHLSVEIISTLLAARRSLGQPQLQELLDAGHISLVEALQELQQSNIVERSVEPDSSAVYQIGSLVLDYLSRYHPPDDTAVKRARDKLKHWQQEQDRGAVQQNTYRYGRKAILIDSNDERIAAPHLRNALNMMRSDDTANAHKSLERAQELTPQWWEVHRVKAHVLEMEKRPIYEIEQAFEESINCEDTDVNRFHYAVYLMRIEEYEKALEQIGRAADHQAADDLALRSIKGLVLLRNGRMPEALEELEYVWNCEDAGATKAPMYSTARTRARPPQVVRLPLWRPLSRLNGATPTRAAICFRPREPRSGRPASNVMDTWFPTPGTLRRSSSFSRHTGLLSIVCLSSPSRSLSSCSSQAMWVSIRGLRWTRLVGQN